uniref:SFRICE_015221 n=1 Tax=Spodoptera frugiperda TaxID=7108 RepID=A0A2H1WH35_SPOFR
MSYRQQYFRTDTTFKPSRRKRTPFLKASMTAVTHLVLRVSMGGADRLPSDSVVLLRNFRQTEIKPSNPDLGIQPETFCPAVALATTRPTTQFIKKELNIIILMEFKF